jgi:large-conductance mechanosensitive channel
MKERVKQLEGSGIAQIAGGVALGMAVWNLASALAGGLLTPLVAVFIGGSRFQLISFTLWDSEFPYGLVIEALLALIVVVLLLAVAFPTLGDRIRRSVEHAPSRITRWWFRSEKDEGDDRRA